MGVEATDSLVHIGAGGLGGQGRAIPRECRPARRRRREDHRQGPGAVPHRVGRADRTDAELPGALRAGTPVHAARGGVLVPGLGPLPRLPASGASAPRCGTSTAPGTRTSTTASGRWPSATRIPPSWPPSTRRQRSGTHFAVTTEQTVQLAEELCRRFRLERVRFTNSGTEATMDAIRVARGATGRDAICKIEGSYHGHHDTVMFSVTPSLTLIEASATQSRTPPASKGIPPEMGKWTYVVPFNDLGALERMFSEHGEEIACFILEPGDDEHRHRAPPARVPRGCPRPVHPPRRGAHLRRGEVRRHHRRGRRHRALRRPAGPGVLRQVHRGRRARGRLRRPGRAHGGDRPRHRPAGDVQRQPPGGGGRPGGTHRGAHARGLRALQAPGLAAWPTGACRRSPPTASPPTSSTSGARAACPTDASRSWTTGASSRPTRSCSRRRGRGRPIAGSS